MSGDRYISQNALIKEIAKIHGNLSTKNVGQAIWDTPTADVVEVVRCKDCKFATKRLNGEFDCLHPHTPWASDEYAVPCQADDFCSYGERREK